MFDPSTIADNVSRWPSLGITLPKDLSKALELFEAVRWVEVGHTPVFNLDGLTAANAEDKIRKFAEQLALSPEQGGGLSPLERAKKRAVQEAANNVRRYARAAVPDAIAQLTPTFDKHAEAYRDAVAKLPADINSDALLAAGAGVVAAYGVAQSEARYLDRYSAWVAQTGYLTGVVPKLMEVTLRILRPASALELSKLDDAHITTVNPALRALEPVFYTAARFGVEFGINTLQEAKQLRERLAIRPEQIQGMATLR